VSLMFDRHVIAGDIEDRAHPMQSTCLANNRERSVGAHLTAETPYKQSILSVTSPRL